MQQQSCSKSKYVKLLGNDWSDFERLVADEVRSDIPLLEAINGHIFSSSGKKLRPLIVLLAAKAIKGEVPFHAKVCAAASELIHTATLLHDDVVDESRMRRGALTVNALFSPGASVLMGDYWLSKAVNILIHHNCDYEIVRNYSKTIEDLAEGEIIQMEHAADLNTTEEDYFEIIKRKTASLFVSSVRSAAIAVKAKTPIINSLSEYACHLGISFQIRDDILDYSILPLDGKDVGSDIAERKITLPLLGALKESPLREHIISHIGYIDIQKKDAPQNQEIIKSVKSFVRDNGGIQYAQTILEKHIGKAIEYLNILPDSESRCALEEMVSALKITT